ncbi:uncharacterized protein DS421_3g72070 [Arachis hypogaea]|nr:uncharacterized protein DS421_3g72070 [Arachis hypogaea]
MIENWCLKLNYAEFAVLVAEPGSVRTHDACVCMMCVRMMHGYARCLVLVRPGSCFACTMHAYARSTIFAEMLFLNF